MINLNEIKNDLNWLGLILISKFPSRRKIHYDVTIVKVCLIGDFIMSYDPLLEMKQCFKGKRVLLICPNLVKPFVEKDDFYSEIIGFDLKNTLKVSVWWKLSSILRKISTNVLYYPEWQRFQVGDLINSSLMAIQKIGMTYVGTDNWVSNYFDHQYTTLLAYPSGNNEMKQMEFYIRKTINSNYTYGNNPIQPTKMYFSDISHPYAVISVSSSVEKKMWPLDRYAAIINSLPKDLDVVVTGAGKDDLLRVEELINLLESKRSLINYVNRTSLNELVALIAQSLFVMGNDSSAVHIAAATRVPSICVLHGAHFNRFFPYPEGLLEEKYTPRSVYYKMDCFNCNYRCIQGDMVPYKCLSMVTVDSVMYEVNKLLKDISYNNALS